MTTEAGREGSQLPIVIVLVVVIVAALGFAVWNAWAPGGGAPAEGGSAAASLNQGATVETMPDRKAIDYAAVEAAEGHLESYGKGSKVKVVACVPDTGGGCHQGAVSALRSAAEKHPNELKVVVVMIHTAAATKAGFSCAGYTINGKQSFEYPGDDGTAHKVTFTKSSDMGQWSVADLERCIQDALDGKIPAASESGESQAEVVGPLAT